MDAGRLHKLGRAVRQIAAEATSDVQDVPTGAELLVGTDIFTHTPTTVSEIAARTGVAQSQVSSVVAQMRSAGMLTSEPDPGDRRRMVLTLTPAARRTQGTQRGERDPRPVVRAHLERHGRDASDVEVEEIVALLDRLADRLAIS